MVRRLSGKIISYFTTFSMIRPYTTAPMRATLIRALTLSNFRLFRSPLPEMDACFMSVAVLVLLLGAFGDRAVTQDTVGRK
jgi:hypothetical protein